LLAFFVVFYHFPSEHTEERFFKSSTFSPTPSTTRSPFFSSLQTLIHLNLITQEITESAENKVKKRKHTESRVPSRLIPSLYCLSLPGLICHLQSAFLFEVGVVCIVKPLDVVLKRRDWQQVPSLSFTCDLNQTKLFVLMLFVRFSYKSAIHL